MVAKRRSKGFPINKSTVTDAGKAWLLCFRFLKGACSSKLPELTVEAIRRGTIPHGGLVGVNASHTVIVAPLSSQQRNPG